MTRAVERRGQSGHALLPEKFGEGEFDFIYAISRCCHKTPGDAVAKGLTINHERLQ